MSEAHMDFAFLRREEDPQKTMVVREAKERASEPEQSMPRRVCLNEDGYISSCPGCRSIQEALEGTERLERARTRANEFYAEVLRNEDKKRKLAERSPIGGDPPAQRRIMTRPRSLVLQCARAKRQTRLVWATKRGSVAWSNLENARPRIVKSKTEERRWRI